MADFVSHPRGVYLQGVLTAFKTRINIDDGARLKVRWWSSNWKSGFKRLLQIANMCLEQKGDKAHFRSVAAYYGMLNLLRALSGTVAPGVADWTERERARCAYFAAVMLDRRIAYIRALWAEQMLDEGR